MIRLLTLPAALIMLGLSATSGSAQVETEVDIYPDWKRKPSPNDLMAVYPSKAMGKGKAGRATIHCKVNTVGVLFDCVTVSEKPEGIGFGAAAIALTPQFVMNPAMKGGKPVIYDGVTIPITWAASGMGGGSGGGRTVANDIPWLEAPTYDQVASAYPEKARASKTGGSATLSCGLSKEGRLKGCSTLGQTPANLGFGAAAKSLAPHFRSPTAFSDGKAIAGAVTHIVVTFSPDMLGGEKRAIGKPQWARLPSGDMMKGAIPAAAMNSNLTTARVALVCDVVAGGVLADCRVDREEPAGFGFGESTLRLAQAFQITVWTKDGLPIVGGQVRVPVRYEIPRADSAPAAKP